MKKLLCTLILFVGTLNILTAQTSDDTVTVLKIDSLTTQKINLFFQKYFENTLNLDIDALLDKTHPALFTISPRDAIKNEMEYSFNNPLFEVTFEKMDFKGIEKGFEYQSVKYYKVNYYSSFSFKFVKSETQSDADFEKYLSDVYPMFATQMPDQKVELHQNIITINGDKNIIVIDDTTLDGLKMLEMKPEMKGFYQRFLPTKVLDELFKL